MPNQSQTKIPTQFLTFSALLLAAAIQALANPVVAGEMDKPLYGKALIEKVDTNRDGRISLAEADAYPRLATVFNKIDANNDGVLTRNELRAHHEYQRDQKFSKLDRDGDGYLSMAEVTGRKPLAAHFAKLDKNADGRLSRDEFLHSHAKR